MNEQEILKKVQNKLSVLERQIRVVSGVEVKLKAKLEESRSGNYIRIYSEDVRDELKQLGRLIFSEIKFYFLGGDIKHLLDEEVESTEIWFSPRVSYRHPSGGGNGCSVLWSNLWFDVAQDSWIYDTQY